MIILYAEIHLLDGLKQLTLKIIVWGDKISKPKWKLGLFEEYEKQALQSINKINSVARLNNFFFNYAKKVVEFRDGKEL